MKRASVGVLVMVVGGALAASAWAGGTINIPVTDDEFVGGDQTLNFDAGGVNFDWGSGTGNEHNVRQDKKVFYSGPLTDAAGNFTLNEISAGKFPYYCESHGGPGGTGMSGTLKVRPIESALKRKGEFLLIGVQWAADSRQTGNQFDVEYKVNDGNWKSWKKNTSKIEAAFGTNGNPVEVSQNKTYRFRARSEDSDKPKRQSGFSPALTIEFN